MKARRYWDVWVTSLQNNWVRQALYRANFFVSVFTDLAWLGVQASLFTVIYAHVDTMAGWTVEQVYFFLGIFFMADALFEFLFMRNFWFFSDLVRRGELDLLLTRPINAVFMALSRRFNLAGIINFGFGLWITMRYSEPAGFQGGAHWVLLPFWLCVGVTVQLLAYFFFSVWVFWTERGTAFTRLYMRLYDFATKPDVLFPRVVRLGLLSVLPFAFVASVPTRALLHGLDVSEYLGLGVVLVGFGIADLTLWKLGLRRYQSASS